MQALAQAIQFGDSGQTSSSSDRTVKFTVTDGASGAANVTDTVHVVLGPSVTTIDRHTGEQALTNATSVAFDVVFSETVTGVGIADFTLTTTGTATGTIASVSGSGADWTVTISGVSGNGTLRLDQTAAGTVIDGNSSALIGTHTGDQSFTIDTIPPNAPAIAATITPDTGSSDTDRITSATTPTLHGTAEAGSTVTLYDTDGTTVLATVVADGGGDWSVATSTLGNGTHSITATAIDQAGNISVASSPLPVTIDTHTPAAPTIATTITPDTGSSATDRITSATTPTLHGTAEAGDTVTLYDTDGTTVLATTTADVNGSWSVATSALGNGTHIITATATDVAGTVSAASTTLSVTIDTHTPAAPTIAATITPDTGSSDTDRITNDNTPILHGTAEAGSTVTLYDTDGTTVIATTTADVNGNWSVPTSALGNGTHSITATTTDVAGTTSAISTALSVAIDTHTPAAPTIAATITPDTGSSATDRITNDNTPTLHGTAEAGSTVTLYDTDGTTVLATVVADGSGDWSVATSALGNGTHSITATASDVAGTVSAASTALSVTIDTHTPAAPVIAATITPDTGSSNTDRITNDNTPTLHGTAEAGDTVTLYDTNGTTVLATVVADGSGNWSVATSALSDGTHSITTTATDVAGTTSAISTALSVAIDTHTPAAPVIAATITPDTAVPPPTVSPTTTRQPCTAPPRPATPSRFTTPTAPP